MLLLLMSYCGAVIVTIVPELGVARYCGCPFSSHEFEGVYLPNNLQTTTAPVQHFQRFDFLKLDYYYYT
uniref:Putative secreted protein n=1 Tax=Anopheles marajoara TaxID=58244 RepID=A0A2M4CET9_9DIPT